MDKKRLQECREEQAEYERRYWKRYEEQRPKARFELRHLKQLAQEASTNPTAALDFAIAMTPENYLMALAADEWDRQNPLYSCRHCRDGAELPKGYVCQVCGTDNPIGY